jgi:hypothetical protein
MMDFHSTDRTVIYAPPLDAASPTIGFLPALKTAFDSALKAPPAWSYAHNANGGTSKGWALEQLKAPGITVELWDQIPFSDARAVGAAAADALVEESRGGGGGDDHCREERIVGGAGAGDLRPPLSSSRPAGRARHCSRRGRVRAQEPPCVPI